MGDSSGEILQTNVLLDRSGIIIETDQRGMVCYFSYSPSSSMPKLTTPVIKTALKKSGVVFGLIDEEISNLNGVDEDRRNVVVARGKRPVMDSDVRLEYLFDTDPYAKFKKDEKNEKIDYRDRGALPYVKAGDVLARIVAETDPVPGKTVFGKEFQGEYAEQAEIQPGKNVRVEANKFIAQIDGAPKLDGAGRVEVSPEWVIQGDVDMRTGNVIFAGKLRIKGLIQPGYEVKCHTLICNGIENKTKIETKGNLIVDGGIQGGIIDAGGRVESRFINNANVTAISDVEVRISIINSIVRSSGSITAQTIFGGTVAALKGITCVNLSSEANRSTAIFGIDPIKQVNISELVQKKIDVEERISIIREKVGDGLQTYEKYNKLREEVKIPIAEHDALKQRRDATDPDDENALEFFDMRLEELDGQIKPMQKEILDNKYTADKVKKEFINEILELEKLQKHLGKLDEEHSKMNIVEDWSGFVPKVTVKGKALQGTRISSSRARTILKKEFSRVVFAQRRVTEADRKKVRGKYYLAVERL